MKMRKSKRSIIRINSLESKRILIPQIVINIIIITMNFIPKMTKKMLHIH
jgi:hypothetical protein